MTDQNGRSRQQNDGRLKIGRNFSLDTSYDISNEYKQLALQNETAADVLAQQGLYNEASYLYIQSMEKLVKSKICEKVNIRIQYFSDRLREIGHSVDRSIEFLIEIYAAGDDVLRGHVATVINQYVLKNVRFGSMHNRLRYPEINRTGEFCVLYADAEDCSQLKQMVYGLKKCLNDLDKLTLK